MTDALDALAERMGIEPQYHDVRGQLIRATPDTKRALLAAMGVPARDEAEARAALAALDRAEWERALPPVRVVRAGAPAAVEVTLDAGTGAIAWRLALEGGGERGGGAGFAELPVLATAEIEGRRLERRRLDLPSDLPQGYHRLTLDPGGAASVLIVSPFRAWLPAALERGERRWGTTVQLYTLRSATDWGIGDYGDLKSLVELMAARGADVVGLNPLHALFPDNPEAASPYSPASRLLLNILNIDVTAIPGFADSAAAREMLASDAFLARRDAVRGTALVDYTAVTALKLEALRAVFRDTKRDGPRWAEFTAFRAAMGETFARHALFLALRAHFSARDPALSDWRAWPDGYRDPASPEVRRFVEEQREEVEFQAWAQWIADTQLGAAAALAAERGMAIGLYRDLAVGADSAGAETWAGHRAVVSGVQVGAPRDIFNPAGQDWGLPPFHPRALREEAYASFVDLVRANMRHAGGLRIDHVMGLLHLFCIPAGRKPVDGAYIAYPFEDLIGILTLESQRNRCLVVGEDLGTVPAGFRERMAEARILSYRILFFEQAEDGSFLPPEAYPPLAMAVLGSHDLPTLRGWWEGRDVDLKERYGLLPTAEEVTWQRDQRDRDKAALLRATGLAGPDLQAMSQAAHRLLARSASLLAVAQLDDLLDEGDQVNVPSTSYEHPNWRRKLSLPLEALPDHALFGEVTALFRAERGTSDAG
jgi:4-alpha-glucanotransferase